MLDNNEENVQKNEVKAQENVMDTPSNSEEKVKGAIAEEVNEAVEVSEVVVETEEAIAESLDKETLKEEVPIVAKVDDTADAVDEIETSVAENAEKSNPKEEEEVTAVDYAVLTLDELVSTLEKIIAENPVQKIKSQVDGVKNAFNQKFGALLAEKKAVFLEEGGNSIDFQFTSPLKSEYNKLLSEHKKQRDAFYNNIEKQLKENLEKRIQVIDNLKHLIEEADTSSMYNKFKVIQDTWRSIGAVSKSHYNDTWKTYHHHVERFYDLLHLSNDFRDLDFKHNLEEKLRIIEKAEALGEEEDVNFASNELQELHKSWKEDVGPVAKEMREEIWRKFSAATKKIHDKRHDHFKEMRSKYQEIIDEKIKVIVVLDAYDTSKNKTHNDWQKSIKEIEALRQLYFNAGKLPYSKSEEVWQKFKKVTKKFNASKNVFYKEEKGEQQENLKNKIALIEYAESLKDTEDWELGTNAMKKVQSDWKNIGHVPRKFSDDIWNRFKAACNHYFDRYHQQKNAISKEQQDVVIVKKEFLEALKETKDATKEAILEAVTKWKALGSLPRNVRHLEGKFNKQIDRMFDGLSLDKNEISMLKFTNVVDSYLTEEDFRSLDSEQMFVRKKIDEIVKEVQQLENNLGFFSNAKPDNPLVLNVINRVNVFKEDLGLWKQKLSYIKKLDY